MKKHFLLVGAIICLLSASCVQKSDLTLSGLNPMAYQTIVNDAQTNLYKLRNGNGGLCDKFWRPYSFCYGPR